MITLNCLTGNISKFKEIQSFLENSDIKLKQLNINLDEIQEVDAKRIIEHKAQEAIRQGYSNFFLDDTSLYIKGLGNLPGPLIKWFLQELKTAGIAKLAKRSGDVSARAVTIIAYVDKKKQIHYFIGTTLGRIVAPRGTQGFGWDSIFLPEKSRETFAEMSPKTKQPKNPRIKALKKFLAAVHNLA